jgi:hypothetical protein
MLTLERYSDLLLHNYIFCNDSVLSQPTKTYIFFYKIAGYVIVYTPALRSLKVKLGGHVFHAVRVLEPFPGYVLGLMLNFS